MGIVWNYGLITLVECFLDSVCITYVRLISGDMVMVQCSVCLVCQYWWLALCLGTSIVCILISRPAEEFNYGVVMTDRSLNDNELFEVKIEELVDRWSGSLEIGVSTQSPDKYDFPASSMNMKSGTWIMSGNTVQRDGHELCYSYNENLDYLKVHCLFKIIT